MILLAAPLALAACDAADDSTGTMMSDEMANSDSMPMSGEMPMTEETGGEQSASAEGTVTDIDPGAGTVTIEHGPVESIGWPAMTMTFEADAQILEQVSVGEGIAFEFRTGTEGSVVTSVTPR
ncbi:copper-binding protein [Qipengyuania sp. GH1]|nr:copper-binding protein [Qipengyuania aestuarii]